MIYASGSKKPYKVAGYYDRNVKRFIGIIYKPDIWLPNTVYINRYEDDYDVVIASVFNGFYYKVIKPGKTGATEPEWTTEIGDTVVDGATFEAVPYNLLSPSESIVTSTFTASHDVVLSNPSATSGTTQVMIDFVPDGVTHFTVTNHTIKSNGEEDNITLLFKVVDR